MASYEDEDKVKIETEPEDSDFAEEHGESVTCVVRVMQLKGPRHCTMPSNLLVKVFGQKQGVEPHY